MRRRDFFKNIGMAIGGALIAPVAALAIERKIEEAAPIPNYMQVTTTGNLALADIEKAMEDLWTGYIVKPTVMEMPAGDARRLGYKLADCIHDGDWVRITLEDRKVGRDATPVNRWAPNTAYSVGDLFVNLRGV